MIFPRRPQILYSPMLASFGGGSANGFKASGGGRFTISGYSPSAAVAIHQFSGYESYTFTGNGTYSVTVAEGGDVEVLLVGGGGGGGMLGGGGGGGAVAVGSGPLEAGSYSITIGAGGQGTIGWPGENGNLGNQGAKGENSSITGPNSFNLVAAGGGPGKSYGRSYQTNQHQDIGNEGGEGNADPSGISGLPTFYNHTTPSGWNMTFHSQWSGGNTTSACAPCYGGGGAGAGGHGTAVNNSSSRGHGGSGVAPTLNGVYMYRGIGYYFGGGGGSDGYDVNDAGNGGAGGGGGGAVSNYHQSGLSVGTNDQNSINTYTNNSQYGPQWFDNHYSVSPFSSSRGGFGAPNSGGGGGAGSNGSGQTSVTGGNGGSGIVLIRYLL